MGARGHTVHVLGGNLGEALADAGQRIAVLGCNEQWTTFVPTDVSSFDDSEVSKALDRALLHVWFDDDAGISVRAYASGEFLGEMSVLTEDADVSASDVSFIEVLETRGVLRPRQRSALLERLSEPTGRREWVLEHGVENLLELPFYDPVPSELPERELRERLPAGAAIVEPRKGARAKSSNVKARRARTTSTRELGPTKASWTAEEEVTLELHREYWATVFSLNNWKLYNRYKKHLPADERRDVDQLCGAIALGNDDALPGLVKSILARIWSCEDWDAVIRDPALFDGDERVWRAWLARVSV